MELIIRALFLKASDSVLFVKVCKRSVATAIVQVLAFGLIALPAFRLIALPALRLIALPALGLIALPELGLIALPVLGQNAVPIYPHASDASSLTHGRQLIDAGKLQEALDVFQEHCRMHPAEAAGFFWTGVCLDEMGRQAEAVNAYRDALTKAEHDGMDSTEIRMNLANTLLKLNEVDQAIDSYKKALEVNPLYGMAQLNLGRAYIARNDFQSANAAFDKCADLHFSAPQLTYYRAKALLGLGKKDEAGVLVQRLLLDLPEGESKSSLRKEFEACLPAQKD